MMKSLLVSACIAAFGTSLAGKNFGHEDALVFGEFESVRLHLEVDLPRMNVSDARLLAGSRFVLDLPAELSLEVESELGLRDLCLLSPTGQPVLDLLSPAAQRVGATEAKIECARITLRDALLEYPAGEYLVSGTALDGTRLLGSVQLSHRLPGFFTVTSPEPGGVVGAEALEMAWTPAQRAQRYVLEIEQDSTDFSLELTLPGDARSVSIPRSLLPAFGEVEYSLQVQGDTDNELEIEGTFELSGV